jgi:signal transduction histidine kinase
MAVTSNGCAGGSSRLVVQFILVIGYPTCAHYRKVYNVLERLTGLSARIAPRSRRSGSSWIFVCERMGMRDVNNQIGQEERTERFPEAAAAPRQASRSLTAAEQAHSVANLETVLVAITGHDLRQPPQILQSGQEFLGLGVRMSSELRCLRSGQNAIDRLKEQPEQIMTALRLRERTGRLELWRVRVPQVLRQACSENEPAALRKGIRIYMVSNNSTIVSDDLLLGGALRNVTSNASQIHWTGRSHPCWLQAVRLGNPDRRAGDGHWNF